MAASPTLETRTERHDRLTYRGNLKETRYGWLRLTPAYSVHLVEELLANARASDERVLDPFCGTGTTALVCALRGIAADTTDINPFLVWLAKVKTRHYSARERNRFSELGEELSRVWRTRRKSTDWLPPLHQIEKWWDHEALGALGRMLAELERVQATETKAVVDLAKVAFCQTLIACANVSFGHQSMSFAKQKKRSSASSELAHSAWQRAVSTIAESSKTAVLRRPGVKLVDARSLGSAFDANTFSRVITSPPYPNRMSYVRELRPYMYWLRYLSDGRAAGELDWRAIGGTWGAATSRVGRWEPGDGDEVPVRGFAETVRRVARKSPLLARYLHKYFADMARHCRELYPLVAPRGTLHYVVGNSKFYDVLVPVERIFAELFEAAGFRNAQCLAIRKRSSKRELFEFLVSAEKARS
ncbi:MAG: SAM-dependent methyltransferase [Myxococcota bacterium]